MPEHEQRRACDDRLAEPVATCPEHVEPVAAENEDPVRMRGDAGQAGGNPEGPGGTAATIERPEQCERREQREAEKQAVHAAVDPVEEEEPGSREQDGAGESSRPADEPGSEQRDQGHARNCEERGHRAQASEAEAEVGDRPGDQEVKRRAATIARHVGDEIGKRVATDEERKRLVLVRRPREKLVGEEQGRQGRDRRDSQPEEPVAELAGRYRIRADTSLGHVGHATILLIAGGRLACRCRSTSTVAQTGTPSRSFRR